MNILSNTDLDNFTVTKAYARWAPVYDLVFGAVFELSLIHISEPTRRS